MDELIRGTVRFEPEFHQRLRMKVAERNIRSIQEAIHTALERWMAEGAPVADQSSSGPFGGLNRDEQKWVEMLLAVLRSGDKESTQAVKSNLIVFHRQVKLLGLLPEDGQKNASAAGGKPRT